MPADRSTAEEIDPAIPLESGETVEWTGRPRWTVVVPAVVVGLALVLAGVIGALTTDALLALVLVPVGLAVPIARYLENQCRQYVVTDRALYVKHGVLSRSVTQATLATVQNSAFTQSPSGTLFGYGSVEFEIAGGDDLAFRAIERPQAVRALVDRATGTDGLSGESSRRSEVPGRLDQWQQIRDELRAVRRALERRG